MPEFTPLQLQLRLRGPHDIDVAMKTTDRVDVTCPELHSRRPFNPKCSPSAAADPAASNSSSSSSSKKTNGTYAAASDASRHQHDTATTQPPPPPPKMTTPSAPPPSLPPIATLPTSSIKTQIAALDTLFEPSTELHTLVLPTLRARKGGAPGAAAADDDDAAGGAPAPPPFASYGDLIRHVGGQLAALAEAPTAEARRKLHGVLGSHPRLGAAKVASAQSRAEQAQLHAGGGDAGGAAAEDEARRLRALNDEYERRFPGLRYVVFVNGRSRPVVMADMRRRIDRGDPTEEEREAIRAMVDIALDRVKKLGATV